MNANENNKFKNRISKIKLGKFGVFLISYSAILISLIIVLLFFLYGLLKDYEKSMPNNTMSKIVKEFTPDNIEKVLTDNSVNINEFESVSSVADYFKTKMQDNEATFKKKSGEFTNTNPIYIVKAGDATIAKVTLIENGKNAHDFTEWKLGNISFDGYIDAENEITITAPSAAEVKVNGIIISDSYITQNDVKFDPVKNVDAYVKTPTNVVYKIGGLLATPNITATLNGVELEAKVDGKVCKVNYPTDAALLESQKSNIYAINEAYGKYLINRGTLDSLNKYLVGTARKNVSDIPAVWAFLYGKTYTYEFKNQKVSDLVKYSDNCFSCNIYYDLYIKWADGEKSYDVSMTYTFVKTNGGWSLADFALN